MGAGGLSALLVGMFPANVHWALSGRASDFAETLWPRTGLQLIFLAATIAVVVHYLRSTDRAVAADRRPSELMG